MNEELEIHESDTRLAEPVSPAPCEEPEGDPDIAGDPACIPGAADDPEGDPADDAAVAEEEAAEMTDAPSPEEELTRLREELAELRREIAGHREEVERIGKECAEFRTLYPGVTADDLPDDALEDMRRGLPLAAAYALSERRRVITLQQADESNRSNRLRSSGAVERKDSGYFSPDEVRSMSREDVRKNYRSILLSMQKWS